MILQGRGLTFLMLLAFLALLIYGIARARRGKLPKVKQFPAVEAIPEAVGRAAEMGKPIHMSSGSGGLHDQWAPVTIAGLAILGRVAEEAAKRGVRIRYTINKANLVPVVTDLLKSAYAKAGKPELFTSDSVYYVGEEDPPMQAAVQAFMYKERPAAAFLLGAPTFAGITLLGAATVIGAIQIAGTPRQYYIPYMISTCDYTLIVDELYAAAAAITQKPGDLGSVAGLDYMKLAALLFFGVGAILSTAGSGWWQALLQW